MAIQTTVVGSYPKPPDEGRAFVVRQTLHKIERGEASAEDLAGARDELVTEVIREQAEAGIDLPTDGHGRWDDILTPFARKWAGFEIGGLLRWFDNNVYYRRPTITGDVEWRGPASVEGFRFAQSVADRPIKAVIPGPITFARLSVDEHYGDYDRLVGDIAAVLAQEVFELEAAGAKHIQIDEPALLDAPEDLAVARSALQTVTADLKSAETTLATYFGDAKRLGPGLFELPVDVFGLDFVSGPDNYELLAAWTNGVRLQAGVVDARNTKLEDADELARTIERIADGVGAENLRVAPSSGLEFLPREKARAKLHRLAEVAGKVGA